MTTPVVDIAVGSRFWAFDLARTLESRGALGTLHTGYPAFAGPLFGVPWQRISSVWTHEPLNRLCTQLHRKGILSKPADAALSTRFDHLVSRRIRRGANIFVGWSGLCLETLRTAKALGMTTFVERGSSHILWQKTILEDEIRRTGIFSETPHPEIVARELAEYAEADYITVPSQFAAKTFEAHGVPQGKVVINPYGVDVNAFQPTRFAEREQRSDLRVLNVGRVSLRKGIQYLVPAVGAVKGASLSLVGDIDRGVDTFIDKAFVRAHGAVSRHKLPAHYGHADVFCLLSLEEGLALVLAQAMAMGLPIVATANTGAAELITDGVEGFIVPARDPAAASEKLRFLAEHPAERHEMGLRARKRIMRGNSWSAYGERAVQIYSQCARVYQQA